MPEAPAYADPGFVEADGWRMHYALTASTDLPAAMAGSYGIVQRRNRAVLVVALEAPQRGARRDAKGADVQADAVGLIGDSRSLTLSRRDEAGTPSWIASVEVRNRVPITIEIRARATDQGPTLHARLTREFRLE